MIFSKETIFDQKKWTILVDLEVEISKFIQVYLKSIKKSDFNKVSIWLNKIFNSQIGNLIEIFGNSGYFENKMVNFSEIAHCVRQFISIKVFNVR